MKKRVYFLWVLLAAPLMLWAQAGSIDPDFNGAYLHQATGTNGWVASIVEQPDGKILIGGFFSEVNGVQMDLIARLNADGTLDETFDPGMVVNGGIRQIALQEDGKILLAGAFETFNGVSLRGFARLNPDGSLDETFNIGPGANGSGYAVLVQPDGKILVGGNFSAFNGQDVNLITRLNPDGSFDESFNHTGGGNNAILSMTIQPDGRIVVGGAFTEMGGQQINRIARLMPNGNLDSSFDAGSGADWTVMSLDITTNGQILVGGLFDNFNGFTVHGIARLNQDGSVDESFYKGSGANNRVLHISEQPDGKVIVAGSFTIFNGVPQRHITMLNSDGSFDMEFNPSPGAYGDIWSLVRQESGKLLIGGSFTRYDNVLRGRVARLHPDGSLDRDFMREIWVNNQVRAIAIQSDGRILIGGDFTSYQENQVNRIARILPDGNIDLDFDPGAGANGRVNAILQQPDGKILIGGAFTSVDGVAHNRIARLNADGSLDTGFNVGSGANNVVFDLALQPDGKIVVAGSFTSVNGQSRDRIARLNPDGSLDGAFDPKRGANSTILNIALQPDGKILASGQFHRWGNQNWGYIVRLNPNGSLDRGFDSRTGANHYINAMVLQPDGKVVIGGTFFYYNGIFMRHLARLNADGSLDSGFDIGDGPDSHITSLALQESGRILLAGNFTSFNGQTSNRLARLHPNGELDQTFSSGSGPHSLIHAMAVQPDNNILISGEFVIYNGAFKPYLARIMGYEVIDNMPPMPDLESLPDVLAECVVYFEDLEVPTATDDVEGTVYGTTDQSVFPITAQGNTTITWTYKDAAGNLAKQYQNIILQDVTPPVALTRDITVALDANGEAFITPEMVDNGSTDNCDISIMTLDQDYFTSEDLGENFVTLTVYDFGGNSTSAEATVTVTDFVESTQAIVYYTGAVSVAASAQNARDVVIPLGVSVYFPEKTNSVWHATVTFNLYNAGSGQYEPLASTGPISFSNGKKNSDMPLATLEHLYLHNFLSGDFNLLGVEVIVEGDISGLSNKEENLITVFKPLRNHAAGGGHILSATGASTDGLLFPPDEGSTIQFGSFVRFNNNGSNPRGEVMLTWLHEGRLFQARSTDIVDLGVIVTKCGDRRAVIIAASELREVLKDGSQLHYGPGFTLVLSMRDRSLSGELDLAGLTLYGEDQVLFSSNWDGSYTFESWLEKGAVSVASNNIFNTEVSFNQSNIEANSMSEPQTNSFTYEKNNLSVFPNPFGDKLNFRFAPAADTQVRLELFDMTGALVEVLFEGSVEANQLVEVQYHPRLRNTSFLFYRLTMGDELQTGKVMYQR
ncbi:MAG: delta-60 repeat domain-containing protein [Bacteroidales bacterium]|nr:delta-60 repeat domain-containing protein [Bacteroidales bacterium]